MKNYLSIIIAATMALFAASCGENYIDEPSTPDTDTSAGMEIDSISSKSVFNYVYNDDVVEISDELAEWIMPDELTFSEKQEIRFKPGLANHKELIPKIGQIIVSQPRGDQMPAGYMGRVTRTTPLGDAYVIDTEIVQLEDVYKDLELDYRLNAEQLRNTTAIICDENDPKDPVFFEEGSETSAPLNAPTNYRPFKDGSVTLKKIGDGFEIKLSSAMDGGSKSPIRISPDVTFRLRPIYKEIRKKIVNNVSQETVENEAWEIDITGNVKLSIDTKSSTLLKKYWVRLPTVQTIQIPIGPVAVKAYDSMQFGLNGKAALTLSPKTHLIIKSGYRQEGYNDPVAEEADSNFDWGKALLWEMSELELEGGVYFKNVFGTRIVGAMPLGIIESEIGISGKANILDKNLYETNPMLSVELNNKFSFRMPKSYIKWLEPAWEFSYKAQPLTYDMFPMFPQIENWNVKRRSDATDAKIEYQTSLLCMLGGWCDQIEFDIVSSEWLNSHSDMYVLTHVTPGIVGFRFPDYRFSFSATGFKPGVDYYAVPICNVFGMKYYGQPLPLKESSERLGIIGPMDSNPDYRIVFGYDNMGHVSKLDYRLGEEKILASYNPFIMTVTEYHFDENNCYVPYPDGKTIFTNAVFDERSGVIKECTVDDGDDSYRAKFYYNDNYNLTRIVADGSITLLEWDKDGKLISISGEDEDYSVNYKFYYPRDGFKNEFMVWTAFCSAPLDFLGHIRLIGKPSTYLPWYIELTVIDDGEKSHESFDIKYEFDKTTNKILGEQIMIENKWYNMPYGYRNVTLSPEVYDHDEFLGTSRSGISQQFLEKLRHIFKKHAVFGKRE